MKRLFLAVVLIGLIVAACGGGGEATTPPATSGPTATRPAGTSAPTTPPVVSGTATPRPTTPPAATPTVLAPPTGQVRIALSTLSALQTINAYAGVARVHLDSMYEYIIGEKDGKPDPTRGFATGWTLSADAKTHTLKVRDNVVFHDGSKASSTDVVWGIDFAAAETPYSAAPTTARTLKGDIASMSAPDATTFVLNLNQPSLYYHLARLSALINGQAPSYLYPERAMKTMGLEAFAKAPVGSGPFKFKNLVLDTSMTFEAVDYQHWRWGAPRVKTMEYRVIPEEATRLALVQSGGADIIGISRTPVAQVRRDSKLQLFVRENAGIVAYTMPQQSIADYPNYGKNPIADVRVRAALDRYAIDRNELVAGYLNGLGTPTYDYPVTVADPSWKQLPAPGKRDVAAAKKLLAEAGYPNGFELDMYVWAGLQPPEGVEIMEQIAVWWEGIGLKVNRKPINFTSFGAARPSSGWPRPTIAGVWYLGNNPVSASIAGTAHDPAVLTITNADPELNRLGKAWAVSGNEADYIKNGQAYMQKVFENVGPTGGGNALMYVGDIFAANLSIPNTWKPGRSQYSFGLERVGLRGG